MSKGNDKEGWRVQTESTYTNNIPTSDKNQNDGNCIKSRIKIAGGICAAIAAVTVSAILLSVIVRNDKEPENIMMEEAVKPEKTIGRDEKTNNTEKDDKTADITDSTENAFETANEIEITKQSEQKQTETLESLGALETQKLEKKETAKNTDNEATASAQAERDNYEQIRDNSNFIIEWGFVNYEDEKEATDTISQTAVGDLQQKEETTEQPIDNVTVNIKIYKMVNGVKTYVKTLTYTCERFSYIDIPMTLSEDPRCKLGEKFDTQNFGYRPNGYSNTRPGYDLEIYPIMVGRTEGEQFKCWIDESATYEITYVYQEININLYKQTEDLQITYIDTYTFKGAPCDKLTIPYYLPDDNNFAINGFSLSDSQKIINMDSLCNQARDVKDGNNINDENKDFLKVLYDQDGNNVIIDSSELIYYTLFALDENVGNFNVIYYYEDISNKIISEIIQPNMSEYEKVKAIHDWLIINADYDYDFNEISFLAEGPIAYHRGVCSGFANAFNRLANIAGIKSMYISGKTIEGVGHAWNLVMVDGEWYHIDCTFDEGGSYGTNIAYTHFLKSDDYMRSDRIFDSEIKCDHDY